MKNQLILFLLCLGFAMACKQKTNVDLILHNGTLYTVNETFDTQEAMAIQGGRIVALGSAKEILKDYQAIDVVDLAGQYVYPGFIDAHAHFYRYGTGLQVADLTGAKSEAEMIERVVQHHQNHPEAAWILGRGWDQNLWEEKKFPSKNRLDELFPDTPVLLTRIDGHAALANAKALELGGVSAKTNLMGGKVILENGAPTGVLVDNAISMVSFQIPDETEEEAQKALLAAQENCFAVGLTSVADAGLDKKHIDLIASLHEAGSLKMRIYAMVNPTPENLEYYFEKGPIQNDQLTVRSFKIYGDGALGSRGAALLAPYHDHREEFGFLLNTPENFEKFAYSLFENGFQMNTHCIGDSANRTLLDIYARVLKTKNDLRWRIEHAQVVNQKDVAKFAQYSIIPSVQPTHATSDMYWAEERLGPDRIKTAYAYKTLLQQNGTIALGSDFPVEDINPLYGFHAAIARKDAENWPEDGFQTENSLTREEALRGMTIWAAFANFEENLKGSLEVGKLADFVVLDQDLMEAPEDTLRNLSVKATYVDGAKVY
ncbi:amidohydrolase [Pararhodonellum marinum]|uniref:amidohydrolase n=1 Tax=Pararhodonellum marinum TaxID=2755358 RepID=UPI00188FA6A1|nr:amidohydrolase [Pararhodonellum marinum]